MLILLHYLFIKMNFVFVFNHKKPFSMRNFQLAFNSFFMVVFRGRTFNFLLRLARHKIRMVPEKTEKGQESACQSSVLTHLHVKVKP